METINAVKLQNIGKLIIRYALALILIYIGALKFTTYEAEGIKPLVENSFLMSWGYKVMSVQGFAALLGVIEIMLGILIAIRLLSPKLSALGSIGAIIMSVFTLTFLFTTPPAWQDGYGFPFLSPMPGQFLLKDLLLIGAGFYTAGESLLSAGLTKQHTPVAQA